MGLLIRTTRRSANIGIYYLFQWDKETGECFDCVNYGPYGVSSSSWMVPGTFEDAEEYDEEESGDD